MSHGLSLPRARAAMGAIRFPARLDPSLVVFGAVALVLCALVLLPIGWLVWYAATDAKGAPTFANFLRLVQDPLLFTPMLTTLVIAIAAGLSACIAAIPIAWLVARTDMPGRGIVRALITASFVTPPFLGAIAWELLAAPNSGMLNQIARKLLGMEEYEYVFNIYSEPGVIFAIACYTFPFVFTVLANALEAIPADLEDASLILGGSNWHTLRRITLPLVLPAIHGRRPDRLPAGTHHVRHARHSGDAGRVPYADDADLEPVPISAAA